MVYTFNNVNKYFAEQLELLNCQEKTKAYIVSILSKYKHASFDYSNSSLTLLYNEARLQSNFYTFQNLADWIFFCEVIFPKHLQDSSKNYYHSLAQVAYYNCYKLINKQIDIYENLADEFTPLTIKTKSLIRNI